jgi:putative transposase
VPFDYDVRNFAWSGRHGAEIVKHAGVTASPANRCTAGGRSLGGLEVNDAKKLRQLEEENRQLKRVVADLALNLQVLKDVLGKLW